MVTACRTSSPMVITMPPARNTSAPMARQPHARHITLPPLAARRRGDLSRTLDSRSRPSSRSLQSRARQRRGASDHSLPGPAPSLRMNRSRLASRYLPRGGKATLAGVPPARPYPMLSRILIPLAAAFAAARKRYPRTGPHTIHAHGFVVEQVDERAAATFAGHCHELCSQNTKRETRNRYASTASAAGSTG